MHDCGHNSFFKKKIYNILCGYITASHGLISYKFWKKEHDYHHKYSNDTDY